MAQIEVRDLRDITEQESRKSGDILVVSKVGYFQYGTGRGCSTAV